MIQSTHHDADRYVDSHNLSSSNIRYANEGAYGHSPSTVRKTVRLDGSIVHHVQSGVENMYNDHLNQSRISQNSHRDAHGNIVTYSQHR